MKIELKQITIGEVVKGYQDNLEAGVVGYDGKLDIAQFAKAFHLM